MNQDFIKTCKNPYYHTMPIEDFRKMAIKYFPDISDKISTTPSRQLIAKICRVKLDDIGVDLTTSYKKGQIYSDSGKTTKKNNQIADQIKGIDILSWNDLKKNAKYNRNCYRKEVLKSIEVKDPLDLEYIDPKDIEKFIEAGNSYIIDMLT